ncbi:hypothetical protein FKP32DRAFT_1676002 [Trametes sanguinea]|nr:hypothetical protein FKP32DRAFT_1676002 [Trametes sanguinea]
MTTPKSMIFFSPSPGTYAVMRLNPVETVRHLDDLIALAEAQGMRVKSHLIMLDMEMALPFPDRPWYRFEVHSIAPCLRDEEPQKGLTSDMCIPIFLLELTVLLRTSFPKYAGPGCIARAYS